MELLTSIGFASAPLCVFALRCPLFALFALRPLGGAGFLFALFRCPSCCATNFQVIEPAKNFRPWCLLSGRIRNLAGEEGDEGRLDWNHRPHPLGSNMRKILQCGIQRRLFRITRIHERRRLVEGSGLLQGKGQSSKRNPSWLLPQFPFHFPKFEVEPDRKTLNLTKQSNTNLQSMRLIT